MRKGKRTQLMSTAEPPPPAKRPSTSSRGNFSAASSVPVDKPETMDVDQVRHLTLNCLVWGEYFSKVFQVTIESTKSIDSLKQAIKVERLWNVAINGIGVYIVKKPIPISVDPDDIEDNKRFEDDVAGVCDGPACGPRQKLTEFFGDKFDDQVLHVVLNVPKLAIPIVLLCIVKSDIIDLQKVFNVKIDRRETVDTLKEVIIQQKAGLKGYNLQDLTIYGVSIAIDDSFEATLKNIDEQELLPFKSLSHYFPIKPRYNHLHIIVETSQAAKFGGKINPRHEHLSSRLRVFVKKYNSWTRFDVLDNDCCDYINIDDDNANDKPHIRDKLKKIINHLESKRSYQPSDCPQLNLAQQCEKFNECYIRKDCPDGNQHFEALGPLEFQAFSNIQSTYQPLTKHYATTKASAVKASSFRACFTHAPCMLVTSTNLQYREKLLWDFPITVNERQDRPSSMQENQKGKRYNPKSDFDFVHVNELTDMPLLFGEIISKSDQADRYHLQIQGIVAARVGAFLTKPTSESPFFVLAIYLTSDLIAERYIFLRGDDGVVYIHQQNRDLQTSEAQLLLREIFNFTSLAPILAKQFDTKKLRELTDVKARAKDLPALTTKIQHDSREDQDDQGIAPDPMFEPLEAVRSLQRVFNKRLQIIHTARPNIVTFLSEKMDFGGYLKFIPAGSDELDVLHYLAAIDDKRNHTIQPIRTWPTSEGTIISMLDAGSHLDALVNPGKHLRSITRQLFEAVEFMHEMRVAHLDLKPGNILIPWRGGTLVIIDFSVSIRVKGMDDMMTGHVGTEGYMAPEVGTKRFSAIRADLWSCGKVMEELCLRCPKTLFRDELLGICRALMDEVPDKRPRMDQVLTWLSNYGSSTSNNSAN